MLQVRYLLLKLTPQNPTFGKIYQINPLTKQEKPLCTSSEGNVLNLPRSFMFSKHFEQQLH